MMSLKRKISFLVLVCFFTPFFALSLGKTYAPEEGTFDRRKRIVIHNKCRLVKETRVPDDVICEYRSQKKDEKNKQIFLGAPGQACMKEITCPKK